MFGMLFNNYCMEIAESIGWVALGFLPVFGSMEVAWRLGKRRSFKPSTNKGAIIKKVSVDVLPR
jgi:hypothetical protein